MSVSHDGSGTQKKSAHGHRWLCLLLICVEIAATGYVGRTWVFSSLLLAVAALGVFSPVRFSPNQQRRYDLVAGLGILFGIKYLVASDNPRYVGLFESQQIAFTISQFLLTTQACLFFIRRPDDRLPVYFPIIGVGALMCAGIVEVDSRERDVFQWLCVLFATLLACCANSMRKFRGEPQPRSLGRLICTLLVLVVAGLTGGGSATLLHRYEKEMDRLVRQFLQPQTEGDAIGFSDQSRLGSINYQKTTSENDIALRIESVLPPGYFRGRVFEQYVGQQWSTIPNSEPLKRENGRPQLLPEASHTGTIFRVSSFRTSSARGYTVWPSSSVAGTFFAPIGTRYLEAETEEPTVDQHGILRSENAVPGFPYSVFVDDSTPSGTEKSILDSPRVLDILSTAPQWAKEDPEIRRIAESIFEGKVNAQQKIGAVVEYFLKRGEYSLEVTLPPSLRGDSLAWFLKENPPAHCEYFATATAVLLRMAGVPCRYVTGFVVSEQNSYGGSWTARNRDAHAWVEAWDGSGRWVVVETTPGRGVSSVVETDFSQELREYILGRFQRLRADWQQRRLRLFRDLFHIVATNPFGLAGLLTLIIVPVWVWLRPARFFMTSVDSGSISPEHRELNRVLRSIDRWAERICGKRPPGETLLAYARRLVAISDELAPAANWYRRYSELRYSKPAQDGDLDELRGTAKQITAQLKKFRAPLSDGADS